MVFPSDGSVTRRPPSLLGVPWVGSPDSQVLLGRSDFLSCFHASLRSSLAPRYPCCDVSSFRGVHVAAPLGLEALPAASLTVFAQDTTGSPRFLGCPLWLAVLQGPAGAAHRSPCRGRSLLSADKGKSSTPGQACFRGYRTATLTRCLRFAAEVALVHARLATGLLAKL